VIGPVKEQGIDDGSVTELDMQPLYQPPYPFSQVTICLCQAWTVSTCTLRKHWQV